MKNISDIAKLAGVSKSTVSRFLNNGSVSNKTKEKLTKIIKEYDYQPNQFAQSIRARRTNLIGAIIPRMNSFAVDETIKGVINQCHLHNYQLLLNYTGLELEAELAALETLSRSKVDGIVLMATNITEQHIQIIEKINVPVIIVGQEHAQLHSIYHDDYQAGFEIGMRIGQKGLHQVTLFSVSERDVAVGIKRKKGLIDALKQYNIEPKIYETTFKYEEALVDVERYLSNITEVDAIVGATDSIALAIHKFCADHKKDLSPHAIFGFGGDPMTQVVSPIIETIHLNYKEAGEQALKEINQLLNHQTTELKIKIPVIK